MLGVALLANTFSGCMKQKPQDRKVFYEQKWNIPSLPEAIEDPADSINLLIWNDYFPQEIFDAFTEIYGVKVNIDYFNNNEELRSKYEAAPDKYDLLMPSDYMVRQFIREGYIKRIRRNWLPKMEELSPVMFELKCDPGLHYFVPIFHSCLGLSFEVRHIGGFPRHWQYMSEHKNNPFIYGRIAFPDQMRTVFAMALFNLNLDPNTTNPEEIKQAEDFLISYINEYGAQIVGDEIIKPEVIRKYLLILTWNGTGANLLSENSNYRFLTPEDQTIFAVDGFVIPKGTQKNDTAYLFLNYLMTAQIMALASEYSYYAPASLLAKRYVNTFISNGPSILVPHASSRYYLRDLGDAETYYLKAWERIKEAKPREDLTIIPLQTF